MRLIQEALCEAAVKTPQHVALEGGNTVMMTYGELVPVIGKIAERIRALQLRTLGLLADNGLEWALVDLSALDANIPLVPLPLFFSPNQLLHVIHDAGIDGILTDRPQALLPLLKAAGRPCLVVEKLAGLSLIKLEDRVGTTVPPGTVKITYTSGTTGEPKGVCLRRSQIEAVLQSLLDASQARAEDRHLCLTPLSTLLENLGGLYVPLLAGARTCLPGLQYVGLRGAAELDVARMMSAMHAFDATSVILAPQMLHAMVVAVKCGAVVPPSLRFMAVGGAPVSQRLLQQAEQLGMPVFEGYGLSECASVVALNTPDASRSGSVGRPLPHVTLSFAEDGEILVDNPGFLGYLGQGAPQRPWPTGDLGYLDAEGYLYLTGRKKSLFITSFGRNVAPEWVERELTLNLPIAQAALFGEARPFNVAVIVPRPGLSADDVSVAIKATNPSLPDYARVSAWVIASEPFTVENGQLTTNGRLKRDAIHATYIHAIEQHYQEEIHDVF